MGANLSQLEPEELTVFKKLPSSNTLLETVNIPERPENRRPTDRKFLIAFFAIVILLFPFLIYCIVMGDLSRLKGYDQCGNVCGEINSRYSQWSCTGEDHTNRPYLQFDNKASQPDLFYLQPRKCVADCESGYYRFAFYCFRSKQSSYNGRFKRETEDEIMKIEAGLAEYLNKNAWKIVLACFLSLAVAIIMLFLFKTATAAVVWGILGGVMIFGAIVVGAMWYVYLEVDKINGNTKTDKSGLLFLAIFFTIMLLVLFCVMAFMYRKIQLVIQLLKESTKAAFAMPLLIFTPIITFFAELIVIILLALTTSYIYSSGVLTELSHGYLYYQRNFVMSFTLFFNFVVALWASQFIIGIQYMVIAGAVAKWYWSKNKNNLDSPISGSASIVFKFHLGSIACGSLIITIVAIIKALISSLVKNKNVKVCVDFCLGGIEAFLKYLSKNSYILTAMHGKPFYKSGKRAAKILLQNVVNISSINYVGDFVLGMAQLLIVLISLLITYGLIGDFSDFNRIVVYVIVLFVSVFIAIASFSIFETTIDTIFLCFCEDSLLNDGMARPYAMSRDLMEFVENSKKIYGETKK